MEELLGRWAAGPGRKWSLGRKGLEGVPGSRLLGQEVPWWGTREDGVCRAEGSEPAPSPLQETLERAGSQRTVALGFRVFGKKATITRVLPGPGEGGARPQARQGRHTAPGWCALLAAWGQGGCRSPVPGPEGKSLPGISPGA